jgi:hypothetical protein
MNEYIKSLFELDRLTPDGTFTMPSRGINYDIRAAAALASEKGRPLTEDELEQFKFAEAKETA